MAAGFVVPPHPCRHGRPVRYSCTLRGCCCFPQVRLRASPRPPCLCSGPAALGAGGVPPLEGAAVLNPAGGMVMAPILMPAAGASNGVLGTSLLAGLLAGQWRAQAAPSTATHRSRRPRSWNAQPAHMHLNLCVLVNLCLLPLCRRHGPNHGADGYGDGHGWGHGRPRRPRRVRSRSCPALP